MMLVTKDTTIQEFVNNGGDVTNYLPKNVRPGKIVIKAKNSEIVIVGDTGADIELDIENTTVTIVEETDYERRERVWEKMFQRQAERHAKWDAMDNNK